MKVNLGLYGIVVTHAWDRYLRYLDILERHVEQDFRDWQQAINQEAQQIEDEDQRQDFYDFHMDEYNDQEQFKVILMNSFFVACFALFEEQLMQVCRRLQKARKSPCSVSDLGSRSPTERTKKYCTKLGIEFPRNAREWSEIARYKEIRNKIVHAGGEFAAEWTTASYAKSKGVVSSWKIGPERELTKLKLTRPFCREAIGNFKRFLLKLHEAYALGVKTPSGHEVET